MKIVRSLLKNLANKEDEVSVVYISTLFNNQNVTVKFGKKK